MLLPKGNVLIEKVRLSPTDVNIMLNNLEQEGFTGFVHLAFSSGEGILFFVHGGIINTLEKISQDGYRACLASKFFNKIRQQESEASVYVLLPTIVNVVSNIHILRNLYTDYKIKKKELLMLMNEIEEGSFTGFLSAHSPEGGTHMLFDKGKLIIDSFSSQIGEIICGQEKVHQFLDFLSKEGAKIEVLAEKQDIIEQKKKAIQEQLNKIKQLIVKAETGIFKRSDSVKIDEFIVKEWGQKLGGAQFSAEIETSVGKVFQVKCSAAKRLGGYAALPAALIKKFGLREGDLLNISPSASEDVVNG